MNSVSVLGVYNILSLRTNSKEQSCGELFRPVFHRLWGVRDLGFEDIVIVKFYICWDLFSNPTQTHTSGGGTPAQKPKRLNHKVLNPKPLNLKSSTPKALNRTLTLGFP